MLKGVDLKGNSGYVQCGQIDYIFIPCSDPSFMYFDFLSLKGKGKENEEKRRRSLLPWRQSKCTFTLHL